MMQRYLFPPLPALPPKKIQNLQKAVNFIYSCDIFATMQVLKLYQTLIQCCLFSRITSIQY